MFCGLTKTLNALYNYLMGPSESIGTEQHRGIIERIIRNPDPIASSLPLSDEEPIEPIESNEYTCQIKLVDGFEFEITATEAELESQKDILKVRQPILVIYQLDKSKLELPQATAIHPLVQTNFEIKTWSEVLDESDIDYNSMVKVSTDPDHPMRIEFMPNDN
jgi:hypothetical protein